MVFAPQKKRRFEGSIQPSSERRRRQEWRDLPVTFPTSSDEQFLGSWRCVARRHQHRGGLLELGEALGVGANPSLGKLAGSESADVCDGQVELRCRLGFLLACLHRYTLILRLSDGAPVSLFLPEPVAAGTSRAKVR